MTQVLIGHQVDVTSLYTLYQFKGHSTFKKGKIKEKCEKLHWGYFVTAESIRYYGSIIAGHQVKERINS